jgi:hypothetical protein
MNAAAVLLYLGYPLFAIFRILSGKSYKLPPSGRPEITMALGGAKS